MTACYAVVIFLVMTKPIELLTDKQVRGLLQVSRQTLWRLRQRKQLKGIRIGEQALRYRRSEVERYLERRSR